MTSRRQLRNMKNKMKEEQKIEDDVQKADSEYSRANKNSEASVRRKKLKSGTGKRKKTKNNKGQRIIMSHSKKSLREGEFKGDVLNMKTAANFYRPGVNRAYSANVYGNPKLRRYEQVIKKLKKFITNERKKLRDIRTVYAKEIESKTQLEQLLRQ